MLRGGEARQPSCCLVVMFSEFEVRRSRLAVLSLSTKLIVREVMMLNSNFYLWSKLYVFYIGMCRTLL